MSNHRVGVARFFASDFLVFSWIIVPQSPENNVRVISNSSENLQRYSQVKEHHQYQQHWWQFATCINDICGKFVMGNAWCHFFGYRWQIWHWPVSKSPAVNFPPWQCPFLAVFLFFLSAYFNIFSLSRQVISNSYIQNSGQLGQL